MKKTFFFFLLVLFVPDIFHPTFAQTYPAMNISLLGNWFDSTVVSEPQHGIKYNGVFGWANPNDGREYAIIGSTAGTYIIEVTNPTQPAMRDFVPGRRDSCVWREVHTYKNYCYIVSDDGLPNSFQIIDLSYLPDSVFVVHDSTNIMTRCHTIFVDGDNLYGGIPKGPFGSSSMAVFSLKNNPESPFLMRRLEEDYPGMQATHDMFVRNDTIYASMSNAGYFVFRYDSVMNKFFLLGSMTSYPYSGYNHSSSVSENGNISIMCDEVPAGLQVKVVNVSDLADISVPSTFQSNAGATPHNPYFVGNDRVVIAYYQDGIQIYDISDPSNPVRSGYFDTRPEIGNNNGYPGDPYQGCWGSYTKLPSRNLIASDMQNGLFVLNASVALGIPGSIAGDINGNGVIDPGEIAGDTNGNGIIDGTEIVGDLNGNGVIDGIEIPGDANNDGVVNELDWALTGINRIGSGDQTICIFPNPFSDFINISFTKQNPLLNFQFFNFTGKIILSGMVSGKFSQFSTTKIPAGIYLIKVSGEDFSETQKFIKE